MHAYGQAVHSILELLVGYLWQQLDGVPERDLNEWRPALAMEDVNTFYALATHTVGSGEYWLLHVAGGRPSQRDRDAEFVAVGSVEQLRSRYDAWLMDAREVLAELTDERLTEKFERGGEEPLQWTIAECIVHAVEHTATHVGHLQLQRQIWNAEQRLTPA